MEKLLATLGPIDVAVMILYILGMIVIGWIASKRVKSSDDFTNAGQSMSLKLVIGSTIATCMGAAIVFGNMELWYNHGWSALPVSSSWYMGWAGLVLMSGKLRSSGASSLPQYFEMKYDKTTRKYASWFTLIMGIASTAAQFLAVGSMAATLGLSDNTTGTIVGAVIIVLFTIFSGLWGVAITDTIQSVLLIVMIAIVLPLMAFSKAGGAAYVYGNTPPEMMTLSGAITPMAMIGLILSNLLSVSAHPAYAQRTFAAKDTKTAVIGQFVACTVCCIVSVVTLQSSFTIRFLFPAIDAGSSFVPLFIANHFPVVLKGLMMSALIALLLTTGDTFLMLLASTVTNDIVKPVKPDLDDKKLILISRVVIAGGAVIITMLGLYIKSIYELFRLGGSAYGSAVFCPLVLSMFWKKANPKAISTAVLVGGSFSFIWDLFFIKSTGIRGVMIGAALNLVICIFGSFYLNIKNAGSAKSA